MTKKVVSFTIQDMYSWEGIVTRHAKFTPETWDEFDAAVATLLKNKGNVYGRELDDQWQEVMELVSEARCDDDGDVEYDLHKEYSSTQFDGGAVSIAFEHEDGTYTHLDL